MSAVTATRPIVVTVATRTPAMMTGVARGSSTRHSRWPGLCPRPVAASSDLGLHAVEPGQPVADEDQEGVADQRDLGGQQPDPERRDEDREEGEAGDRVQDPAEPQDRTDEPATAMDEDRHRERDQDPADHGDQGQHDMLRRRLGEDIRVVDDPVEAEERLVAGHAGPGRSVLQGGRRWRSH